MIHVIVYPETSSPVGYYKNMISDTNSMDNIPSHLFIYGLFNDADKNLEWTKSTNSFLRRR
jgi:hypothetical protein